VQINCNQLKTVSQNVTITDQVKLLVSCLEPEPCHGNEVLDSQISIYTRKMNTDVFIQQCYIGLRFIAARYNTCNKCLDEYFRGY
jgi:hypothetical protein